MYIHPFAAGVFSTILVLLILFFLWLVVSTTNKED